MPCAITVSTTPSIAVNPSSKLPRNLNEAITAARKNPEALLALATSSHELWEEQGDSVTLSDYLRAVDETYLQLAKENQIELPAVLLELLFSIQDQLPSELISSFGGMIRALPESQVLSPGETLQAQQKALHTCKNWIETCAKLDLDSPQNAAALSQIQRHSQLLPAAFSERCEQLAKSVAQAAESINEQIQNLTQCPQVWRLA